MEIKFGMKLRVKQGFYEGIEGNAMYEDDGLISLKNNLTGIIIVNKDFLEAIEEIESN